MAVARRSRGAVESRRLAEPAAKGAGPQPGAAAESTVASSGVAWTPSEAVLPSPGYLIVIAIALHILQITPRCDMWRCPQRIMHMKRARR